MDKTLLIVSSILLIVGLIMVFSASNVTGFMKYQTTPYHFFGRQLFFLIVGIIISVIMLRFNTKTYGYFSWGIILALIGLLVAVLVYGKIVNQAKSWINIANGISIQPSEFVKVATIVWMAFYCTNKKRTGFRAYLLLFGIIGLIAMLIILQPDLGTASIYLIIVFMMFMALDISRKVKRNIILTMIGLGIITIVLLMNNGVQVFFERQLARFDYFNPCSEEKFYTTGTQLCNGYIAMNNGGLMGLGLGNSTQKYLYLPEAYTDFIFAITVEELGLVTSIILLLLIFVVLWRIFLISKRASTERGKLMCYGVFWYILLHTIINLGGIMGLIPLTGVPLPFFSYGGSFLICLIVSIAIVQRVAIETKSIDKGYIIN